MLTKKQLNILEPFTINIFREYSSKELKKFSFEKSNNAFSIAVKKLRDENLIIERKIGTSILYKLNLDNFIIYDYISILNYLKLNKEELRTVIRLKKIIETYTAFYSLIIFGSRAAGQQKKNSDLDIAIIINNKKDKKNIESLLYKLKDISILKLDLQIIYEEEFFLMLKTDYENLGKEIARKNMPIINTEIFYSLIRRGVENGFTL